MRELPKKVRKRFDIPRMYTGTDKLRKGGPIVDALRELEVGDKTTFPISKWRSLGAVAKCINIKIVTRSLGSKKEITVWRIE